jgi:rhamnosyltransferase
MPLVSRYDDVTVDATVFIPTFNGEKYLDLLLTAVESQHFDGNFEILVIDSGSTDRSLEILRAHPAVHVIQIPPSEFGHGKTRNLAAELGRGTYIAYLSHDAIPVGDRWLDSIVSPMAPGGLDCEAVVGRHVARSTCFPSLKYEIAGVFYNCGPSEMVSVTDGKLKKTADMTSGELFYSDVNSAARRKFLTEVIPYRDVAYSEDMAFAKDLLDAGYRKAYQPDALVEHSNDVTLREYPKRIFDETLGLRRLNQLGKPMHIAQSAAHALVDVWRMSKRIIRDPEYGRKNKVRWLLLNPLVVSGKWLGIYRATHVNLDDYRAIRRYSLEAERA